MKRISRIGMMSMKEKMLSNVERRLKKILRIRYRL